MKSVASPRSAGRSKQPAKNPSQKPSKRWWEGRGVSAVYGLVDLALAYIFLSWALNSGSYWEYLAALVFAVIGATSLIHAIRKS